MADLTTPTKPFDGCMQCGHEHQTEMPDDPRCLAFTGGTFEPEYCECLLYTDVLHLITRKKAEAKAQAWERLREAFRNEGDDPQHARWTLVGILDVIDYVAELAAEER